MPNKPVLTLLTRPGCHLCEAFHEALEQAFPGRFDVREADVDAKPEWRERFGPVIPVLLDADGKVLGVTRFDPTALPEG